MAEYPGLDLPNLSAASTTTAATIRRRLAAEGVSVIIHVNGQQAITAAANSVAGAMNETLSLFASALHTNITRNRRIRIKELLEPVGRAAIEAVGRAYDSEVHGPSGYRQGERYSGGRLRRAITSPNMYEVARDGINFINVPWLDSQAKQWYRLNFGAGKRGRQTPSPRSYRIMFFGSHAGTLRLDSKPSPGFYIPAGIWVSGASGQIVMRNRSRRGKDRFLWVAGSEWPNGAAFQKFHTRGTKRRDPFQKPKLTDGIRGMNFLDAGVRKIAELAPVAYTQLITEWIDEAARSSTGPFRTINVPAQGIADASRVLDRQMASYLSNSRTRSFTRSLLS